ncbi:MAG: FAD-dependent oxidoreductase [Mariprofundus sp.]|nr:FAD-dependent oxidoreductase [Mariprofundus sp.]
MNMQTQTDFDVVVVGGGAVGVMLALSLQRLNYRVAVIEQRAPCFHSSNPERVVALNYGSRCYLEALGLWDAVLATGLGDIRHIVVSEPGNRGQFDLHAGPSDVRAGQSASADMDALGYVVEMGALLEPMYQALHDSDIALISPACVESYTVADDGAQVSIQLRRGNERSILTAALLVGADGSFSQIRMMAGIGSYGWDHNRFGLVASIRCEHGHSNMAHECFRSSGPLAFLPLADGRFSIVWAATPAEATALLAMDDEAFMTALQRAAGEPTIKRLGAIVDVSRRASFALELSIAKSFNQARMVLVGNAAHTIHPVAGQGMNLGFRDVQALVEVLEAARKQQQNGYCDPGQAILLQAYSENRRADVAAVAGFTESMLHVFGSAMPGMKWLRGLGLAQLGNVPILADLLLKQASGVGQIPDHLAVELESKRGDKQPVEKQTWRRKHERA